MKYLKPLLPHFLFLILGLILVSVFFSPLVFGDKIINQNDIYQGVASAGEITEYRKETGEEALWTTRMFSGMPAYLINTVYSGALVIYVQKLISVGLPSSAQVVFLAFLSFYILLISFKVRPILAFAGAIAYAFNTFNLISVEAGHIWKVRAIAYMPLVVSGVHLILGTPKKILGLGLLSLAISLEIYANHLQITYYLFLFLIPYGVIQLISAIKEKTLKDFGVRVAFLLAAALIGVGSNAARLWTTVEYGNYSTRGKSELTASKSSAGKSGLDRDYVFNWSYGIQESLTLLIPNFSGGASTMTLDVDSNLGEEMISKGVQRTQVKSQLQNVPTYWGKQPIVAGPSYLGAIVLFFAVLGIYFADKKIRNWLISAAILGLVLAWGKNFIVFNDLMYDFFPGYNKFRSVSMAMTITLLAVPILGFLGIEGFLKSDDSQKWKKLLISAAIPGGLALLLAIGGGFFGFNGAVDGRLGQLPDWYLSALKQDRKAMMTGDAWRSFVLIGLVFGSIYLHKLGKVNMTLFSVIVSLLVLVDFWFVDKRYLNDENYIKGKNKPELVPTAADNVILQREGDAHYRVLNLQNPFNEASTSAFHSSLGGYHGAKMKRYQELIDYSLSNQITGVIDTLRSNSRDFSSFGALNMLNAKYLKFGPAKENVLQNSSAYGNAWLVSKVDKVTSADEEIDQTNSLDDKQTAIVNATKFNSIGDDYDASGTIALVEYKPNYLRYDVNTSAKSLALFSEIYYPKGWKATIDGKDADIIQANYVLRGLEIPAGSKKIEFSFEPRSYYLGNQLSLVFSIIMLGIFGYASFLAIKKSPFFSEAQQ